MALNQNIFSSGQFTLGGNSPSTSLDMVPAETSFLPDGLANRSVTPTTPSTNFNLGMGDRIDMIGIGGGGSGVDTPWYKDSGTISAYAGLGSALASLAALPSAIKYANTQTKTLEHNLDTAREEQARRNKNIASFNAVDTSQYA